MNETKSYAQFSQIVAQQLGNDPSGTFRDILFGTAAVAMGLDEKEFATLVKEIFEQSGGSNVMAGGVLAGVLFGAYRVARQSVATREQAAAQDVNLDDVAEDAEPADIEALLAQLGLRLN